MQKIFVVMHFSLSQPYISRRLSQLVSLSKPNFSRPAADFWLSRLLRGLPVHWLPYPHRIAYRISASVRCCIEGLTPPYLRELCCSTTQAPGTAAVSTL